MLCVGRYPVAHHPCKTSKSNRSVSLLCARILASRNLFRLLSFLVSAQKRSSETILQGKQLRSRWCRKHCVTAKILSVKFERKMQLIRYIIREYIYIHIFDKIPLRRSATYLLHESSIFRKTKFPRNRHLILAYTLYTTAICT